MNLNVIKFIGKIILAEVILFCLLSPCRSFSDTATKDVTLAWDANEQSNLAGYYLYHRIDSPGSRPSRIKIKGNTTTYTIRGLDPKETYIFWVTTYDGRHESGPSNEATLCRNWYRDEDGDGYGNPKISIQRCSYQSGYVENSDDCDDSDPDVAETCPEHNTIYIHPGQSIQTAINSAKDGDVIIIYSGTYKENIDFMDKAITVRSTNPNDPSVVASTIIDGSKKGTVISFYNDEKSDSILSGITVRNGNGIFGGGIYCTTSPTIINCVINENSANYGGGICCFYSSATIKNCTISRNSAKYGGAGIYGVMSPAAITNCTISKNTTARWGGGINFFLGSSTITNCIINKNSGSLGGGIYCGYSSPRITNTIIYENSTSSGGGGIYCTASSNPNITNCVISGNSARFYGGGIYSENGPFVITNCLFWENSPGDLFNKIKGTYTNINKDFNDNIKADPLFVNPVDGNFHIKPSSPCIDAGTGTGAPEKDKDGNQRPIGKGFDIGAYEFDN